MNPVCSAYRFDGWAKTTCLCLWADRRRRTTTSGTSKLRHLRQL